ncbi:MAG: diguanylate cyclase [Armatimonadetes bacterium]|nr:diguanylate cyclase [Armatimonadota bacterium]
MRALDELGLVPAWVNPNHMVATAAHVMQGHRIKAAAVMTDTELVGFVTLDRVSAMPKSARVRTIVQPVTLTLDESTPIRDAAKRLIEEDVEVAAVYRDDEFRGLLSSNMLLRELGRSWDPLTDLAWSNRLREWGTAELEEGNEITVVFVDVDDFGNYNKKHGHVVGDEVLKQIAARLQEQIDPASEVLVRFGGDEFAVGTRLSRFAAEQKFAPVENMKLEIEDVREPVTVTVGFAGGKRSKDRQHVHAASMLDNLINLASRECMARKRGGPPIDEEPRRADVGDEPPTAIDIPEPVAATDEKTYEVRLVSVDEENPDGPVAVTLRVSGVDGTGAAMPEGRDLKDSVAEAAAHAIERIHPDVELTIAQTVVDAGPDGGKTVTVVGTCTVEGRQIAIAGTIPVARNVHRAVAEAVAAAFASLRKPRAQG